MNNKLYFECLQLASGHYLSANLPNNWYDWTEAQQNEFLIENNWELFKNVPPETVWNFIEDSARVTYEFIQNLNKE